MATIIDRRLHKSSQNAENVEKFRDRHKAAIKKFIKDKLQNGSVKDFAEGKDLVIPISDTEPNIGIIKKNFDHVFVGNKKYRKGDTIPKPEEDSGKGSSASEKGKGEDKFKYTLSKEDLDEHLFKYLKLPRLTEKLLKELSENKFQNAGYKANGIPSNLSVVRSYKNAIGRQAAMEAAIDAEIKDLENQYFHIMRFPNPETKDFLLVPEIHVKIKELEEFKKTIPFLDDIDLRYRYKTKKMVHTTKAVMFCLLDRSGSMSENRKNIAKQFFILLALFLQSRYEKIEIVFVVHDEDAHIVEEKEFFYSTANGGTIISSGLKLIKKTIDEKYPPCNYNIYIAHATDCDNWENDDKDCIKIFNEYLLPICNMYAIVGTDVPNSLKSVESMNYTNHRYTNHVFLSSKEYGGSSKKIRAVYIDRKEEVFDKFIEIFKE